MNCEELRQNTAAYALDALTDAERAEFEQHIVECGLDHDIEVFGEVTSRLLSAAPEMDPPPGLRDRILGAAAADLQAEKLAHVQSDASAGWVQRLQQFSAPAYGAAAVALIVIGALIGWGLASVSESGPATELNHFRRDPEGDWLRVETTLGKNGLMLSVGNLEPLSGQSTYQFWAIRDDHWVPIGDFNTNVESKWSGYFEFALKKGDAIAITVEPGPGRQTPSAEAAIQSRI